MVGYNDLIGPWQDLHTCRHLLRDTMARLRRMHDPADLYWSEIPGYLKEMSMNHAEEDIFKFKATCAQLELQICQEENGDSDPYEVLGISDNSSGKQIYEAYASHVLELTWYRDTCFDSIQQLKLKHGFDLEWRLNHLLADDAWKLDHYIWQVETADARIQRQVKAYSKLCDVKRYEPPSPESR